MKVGIIDYGLGNLKSVYAAFQASQSTPVVSKIPKELKSTDKLVLPGVGAFGDAMNRLKNQGLDELIEEQAIELKKPILGICLGFQLFFEKSNEFGTHEGLGYLDGALEKFNNKTLSVPHIGWNDCERTKESSLLKNIEKETLFYYVHSYYVKAKGCNEMVGSCNYGVDFVAAFQKENLYGVQFHPEKSQLGGLQLIKNFLAEK